MSIDRSTDIKTLPAALISVIRAGIWPTPSADQLRILARATRHVVDLGVEPYEALKTLARAVQSDLAGLVLDGDLLAIRDLCWPYLASPIGMRPCYSDHINTIADAIAATKAHYDAQIALISMTEEEASEILQSEAKRLAALYPDLGISFGYIGNIWSGPYQDDRSFRYFSQLAYADDPCCRTSSVSFGDFGIKGLAEFAFRVKNGAAEAWAADAAAKLASGAYKRRAGNRLAA